MSLEISVETTFILDMVNPTYGVELHTNANAVADPAGAEADAITGFGRQLLDGTGANVFESQGAVKTAGSYAFHSDANDTPSDDARFYTQLDIAPFSLINGDGVKIEFGARHIGSGGDWEISLGNNNSAVTNTIITTLDSTETTWASFLIEFIFSANTRFLVCRERSATDNGGIYFDNLSVKKAT